MAEDSVRESLTGKKTVSILRKPSSFEKRELLNGDKHVTFNLDDQIVLKKPETKKRD